MRVDTREKLEVVGSALLFVGVVVFAVYAFYSVFETTWKYECLVPGNYSDWRCVPGYQGGAPIINFTYSQTQRH